MRTRSRRKPLSHYLWGKNIAHKITTYFGNKICCPRTHQSSMNPAKWIKICILLYLWSVNWIIKCEWQTIINTFRQFSYYPLCRIKYVKNIIKFLSIYKKDRTIGIDYSLLLNMTCSSLSKHLLRGPYVYNTNDLYGNDKIYFLLVLKHCIGRLFKRTI